MINKMQTKMITHILKGTVQREEDFLSKIKETKTMKKTEISIFKTIQNKKSQVSKKKLIENEEEYKFIATDNTLPNEKEEYKSIQINMKNKSITINEIDSNNIINKNDIIKVTENVFINDSNIQLKNYKIYDTNNYDPHISQKQEMFYKSGNDRVDMPSDNENNTYKGYRISNDTDEYHENENNRNKNALFYSSNRIEMMQKETKDNNDYIDSNNSLRRSTRKSLSPGNNVFINNLKNSSDTKFNLKNDIVRRSSEILMKSSIKKNAEKTNLIPMKKRNTLNPNNIIPFNPVSNNIKSANNSPKNKRKSQVNSINNIDYPGYKNTNSNSNSNRNRKNSKDTGPLNTNENQNNNSLQNKIHLNNLEKEDMFKDSNNVLTFKKEKKNTVFQFDENNNFTATGSNEDEMKDDGQNVFLMKDYKNDNNKDLQIENLDKKISYAEIINSKQLTGSVGNNYVEEYREKESIIQNVEKNIKNEEQSKKNKIFPKSAKQNPFNRRSKSEFNIQIPNQENQIIEERKSTIIPSEQISKINFNKNNASNNIFNLEKIDEIENTNSNMNNSNNKSLLNSIKEDTLKLQEIKSSDIKTYDSSKNNNIGEMNNNKENNETKEIKDKDFYTKLNEAESNNNLEKNYENLPNYNKDRNNKNQRPNSISGSMAITNTIKNSRISTSSRLNTSNTEKKMERKRKKMTLISTENFKNDFINYEKETNKKINLHSKKNSENEEFQKRKNKNFSNFDNEFNTNEKNKHKNKEKIISERKEKRVNFTNCENTNEKFKSSYGRLHDIPNYDNLHINYKNDFDMEINEKINHFNSTNNKSYHQSKIENDKFYDDLYLRSSNLSNKTKIQANINITQYKGQDFESFNGKFFQKEKISLNKSKEIHPMSVDKFKDLSPIRESEYSYDVYKKPSLKKENLVSNYNYDNFTDRRINIDYNYDNTGSLNNLYNFKNNKNNNFIYDEVHEKILPIKNFEGESYPENLFRDDKHFYKEKELKLHENPHNFELNEINNRMKNSNRNEFTQTNSTFGKKSNLSTSKIRTHKKSDSSYVPWEKVYKERFKDDFNSEMKILTLRSGKNTKKI